MHKKRTNDLIAPCGMNCQICVGFFGYTMNGKKRKMTCVGCKPRNKSCAFLKKHCITLSKNEVDFCFECSDYPCENLKKLDKSYREKYNMSTIENLEYIKQHGLPDFLRQQKQRYSCAMCGNLICVHTKRCYTCDDPMK